MAIHLANAVLVTEGTSKSKATAKKNTTSPKTATPTRGRIETTPQEYDFITGKWVDVGNSTTQSTSTVSPSNTTPKEDTTTSTPTGSSQTDQKEQADKEYIETEFNVLTGDLTITSTEKSIRLKVNDTVKLEGIGNYLSGLYFVQSIRRSITKDGGYSHVISLIKNGFGNSVKKAVDVEKPKEEPRKEEVVKTPPELKVGDKVKIVGDNAVYSNAHDGVKVPDWVKKKTHTIYDISNDKTRVLLKEIWSWTYVKFIQKS